MRRSERTDAPVGYAPTDHVCWVYRGSAAWPAAVVPFLQDGVVGHDRLLYAADKPELRLIDDLAALPGRDRMLASGQLEVRPLAEAYVTGPDGVDAGEQVGMFEGLSRAAVADGYRSLRLAADVTPLATSPDAADRFTAYELLVDAMGARTPWTSLCGYDRDRVGPRVARASCFVHPVHRDAGDPVLGRLHADAAGRWCLSGEVDLSTADALRVALAALPRDRPVHMDLSTLDHIDAASLRALTELGARLAPVGGLVVHRPPALVTWMLDRLGTFDGVRVRS